MHPPAPISLHAPGTCGIGLRRPHMADVLARRPMIGFFEIHPENYILDHVERAKLQRIRKCYPLSVHSVGLSLGSAGGVNAGHLSALAQLVRELEPMLVSDHLSWSTSGQTFLNDLLPFPYTFEALDVFSQNVARVQDTLERRLLVENPSRYAEFVRADFDEIDFLRELVKRTGCGLLLDVNNVHVSAANLGFDARTYIESFPVDAVEEIHLAGHVHKQTDSGIILIDDHGSQVSDTVWELYAFAKQRWASTPTLVEWDSNIPSLDVLVGEAHKADRLLSEPVSESGKLVELQQSMARAILSCETQAKEELGLRGHFSVHANNVRHSLVTALEAAFPATRALVGDDYFHQVAWAFVGAHPPQSACIAAYGEGFPEYLHDAPGAEALPYLADTARVDWLAGRLAMVEPKTAMTRSELTLASQCNDAGALKFDFQPAVDYLSSPWSIDRIWAYARDNGDRAAPRFDDGAAFMEIVHDGVAIRLHALEESEFVFRRSMKEGASLADADSRARAVDPFFDLCGALRAALRDGILVNCTIPSPSERT